MSEENVEDVLENLLRQSLLAGSQLAEQLARARQQIMRNTEQRHEQAAVEAQRSFAANQATMRSIVIPTTQDDWWSTAKPEQIAQAYVLAETWKEHDPGALAASEKISKEVQERYGIDTADVQDDVAYLQDNIAMREFADNFRQDRVDAPPVDLPKFTVTEFVNDSASHRGISKEAALALIESTPADQKKEQGWGAVDDIQRWVGKDAEVGRAIGEKFPDLLITREQRKAMYKEQIEAMDLLLAAQAEQIKRHAPELRDEMKRHAVPHAYLANDEMLAALQASKAAIGTDAALDADRAVAERAHLIERDGINGLSIDQLRKEVGENYSGTEDGHFMDAEFVAAARDWHEAKILAEGGFVEKGNTGLEARYENAEKELFARIAPMGQEIQDKVLKDPHTKTPTPADKIAAPAYGSKEHYKAFEASLQGTATETEIKGRAAAARGQAKHPNEAVKAPTKTPKARKATAGAGMDRDKSQDGPAR